MKQAAGCRSTKPNQGAQTNRLVAYTVGTNRHLELMAVRETSWDMKLVSWGRQLPEVKDVRDACEQEQREKK